MDKLQKRIYLIEKTVVTFIFIASILGGFLFGYVNSEIKNYSGINDLKKFQPNIPTRIYDVNGELIAELFQEKRELVAYEDLPDCLINAFLASEDRNFYNHFGINPIAIIRAFGKNIVASIKIGKLTVVQGGSTITQQLAKQLFTRSEKTYARKVKEAMLALQIEKRFTKEQILEMYFNQIYLGHGCNGIATAAQFYFGKDVKYLTVAESSVLAALPSRPEGLSPIRYPRAAQEKNVDTLKRMVDAGFIDQAASEKVYQEFWPGFHEDNMTKFPSRNAKSKKFDKAPYFTDYVRQILISRFGKDVVYNDGLSIYTTLNLKRQKIAQKFLKEGLIEQDKKSSQANAFYNRALDRQLFGAYDRLRMIFSLPGIVVKRDPEARFKKMIAENYLDTFDALTLFGGEPRSNIAVTSYRNIVSDVSSSLSVEGAIIAIESKTGYITTMVGGSEYNVSNQYNRAVQARRQPGSSFKPFVYGAAIDAKKITAATALPDAPIADIDEEGSAWSPGNYEGDYSGIVRIRRALAASINIISVRIFDLIGAEGIIDFASKMLKVPKSRFNPNPSLALGTTEFTPFEMANAYAIYANKGKEVIPFAIRYVVDRDGNELVNIEEEVGNILAQKQIDESLNVIPESVAFVMTSLMRDVIDRGTAHDSIRNVAEFKKQAAGKTGTTTNWTDAWFCGFTPDIATVVWVGYDQPFMSLGKHQSGSAVAAPIWANYMRDIYNGLPNPAFSGPPKGVYRGGICKDTGLVPSEKCTAIGEYFIRGTGAGKKCDGVHQKMESVMDRYMKKEGLTETE